MRGLMAFKNNSWKQIYIKLFLSCSDMHSIRATFLRHFVFRGEIFWNTFCGTEKIVHLRISWKKIKLNYSKVPPPGRLHQRCTVSAIRTDAWVRPTVKNVCPWGGGVCCKIFKFKAFSKNLRFWRTKHQNWIKFVIF